LENDKTARRRAGASRPEPSGTQPTASRSELAAATSATSDPPAVTPSLAPVLASEGTAAADASLDRQQPRVLILEARQSGYNAAMLLAIVLAAALAFMVGREFRRAVEPARRPRSR
jgi:hypothetical protein